MEIERKYLVNKGLWLKANKPDGEYIYQGYLTTDIDKTIRVRVKGSDAYMTIKGKTINITREEYEFAIPLDKATAIIQKFAEGIIEKIRYTFQYKEKIWEIDEFLGDNIGLLLAEIELNSEGESFTKPEWIAMEVSNDSRYYNSNLLKQPFTTWLENSMGTNKT